MPREAHSASCAGKLPELTSKKRHLLTCEPARWQARFYLLVLRLPKVIANEDAYPVYDDDFNYVAFMEHWEDFTTGHSNYVVYTPTLVQHYIDNILTKEDNNLSGLPIRYCMMDKTEYNLFGDSIMNDLMPIMDQIESLLSKLDDAITTLSLNPIGVSYGPRIDESIPKDIVGTTLNLEDGGDFKWVNAQMDYNTLNCYWIALCSNCTPLRVIGQGNISNVSEVSLKLLFSQTDNRQSKPVQVLKEGFYKRFEYFRKLLAIQGTAISDDDYDTLDITFSVNRPVDTQSLINELKTQYDMGAISKQTIIDISPYTKDTRDTILCEAR